MFTIACWACRAKTDNTIVDAATRVRIHKVLNIKFRLEKDLTWRTQAVPV
jgi:hypothetical protein